jgi:hypothetical protein
MHRHPLAAMEDLDRACGGANFNLGADERMRDRIEKAVDLNVVIEIDASAAPIGELPVVGRQRRQRAPLDLFEQLTSAHPELAHGRNVHALHDERDGRVAFGEGEERQLPQPTQNVGLGEPDAGLDLRFVARPVGARRQHPDAVMRGHRAIGPVDLRVIKRGLVDAALEIVGNQQLGCAVEEAEHANVGARPVG